MVDRNMITSNSDCKPYCVVGARELCAFIWKRPSESGLARYTFNLMRLSEQSGRSSHLLRHLDLTLLVKLLALLARVIEDDGCLEKEERSKLRDLAFCLETVASRYS